MKTRKHNKVLSRCIRQVYASLKTHLPYTHASHPDGKRFHKKVVREYSKLIDDLARLYR